MCHKRGKYLQTKTEDGKPESTQCAAVKTIQKGEDSGTVILEPVRGSTVSIAYHETEND